MNLGLISSMWLLSNALISGVVVNLHDRETSPSEVDLQHFTKLHEQ